MAPGMPYPMGAIYEDATRHEESINLSILSTDVFADQARLEKLGARVVVPATAVSDVTTFGRVSDPQGDVFSLFANDQTPERLQDFAAQGQQQIQQMARQPTPGTYARFEIGTTDAQAIETFYTQAGGSSSTTPPTAGPTPTSSPATRGRRAACTTTAPPT
jgi:uncharacterized protein